MRPLLDFLPAPFVPDPQAHDGGRNQEHVSRRRARSRWVSGQIPIWTSSPSRLPVPDYEVVQIQHRIRRREVPPDSDNSIDDEDAPHGKTELKLKAFGKYLNLTLVPNRGLYKKNKLKIWTVEPNATAQHGVEYIELPEVSSDFGQTVNKQTPFTLLAEKIRASSYRSWEISGFWRNGCFLRWVCWMEKNVDNLASHGEKTEQSKIHIYKPNVISNCLSTLS